MNQEETNILLTNKAIADLSVDEEALKRIEKQVGKFKIITGGDHYIVSYGGNKNPEQLQEAIATEIASKTSIMHQITGLDTVSEYPKIELCSLENKKPFSINPLVQLIKLDEGRFEIIAAYPEKSIATSGAVIDTLNKQLWQVPKAAVAGR